MIDHQFDKTYKVILVGDNLIGKSSFLDRYADGTFPSDHYSSVIRRDFVLKTINIQQKKIRLVIWDYNGRGQRWIRMSAAYIRNSYGILLMFDITNRSSFQCLNQKIQDIDTYILQKVPMILIGTKLDLQKQRKISTQQAQNFALQKGFDYIEISSKQDVNVNEVFVSLTSKMLNHQYGQPNVNQTRTHYSNKQKTQQLSQQKIKQKFNKPQIIMPVIILCFLIITSQLLDL